MKETTHGPTSSNSSYSNRRLLHNNKDGKGAFIHLGHLFIAYSYGVCVHWMACTCEYFDIIAVPFFV